MSEIIATRDGKSGGPLLTVQCSRCGLGRVDPFPSAGETDQWYADHYRRSYKGAAEPSLRHVLRAARNALMRWEWLNQQQLVLPWKDTYRQTRSLDIGASSGEFVALMHKVGIDAYGIEPNNAYAAYAKANLHLKVLKGSLEHRLQDFEPESFQLITMFHVLEHLVEPIQSLRLIAKHLAACGILYIEVPNAARACSPNYMFFRAHVLYFTGLTLRQTLETAGLQILAFNADSADNLAVVAGKLESSRAQIFEHRPDLVEAQRKRRWIPYFYKELINGRPFERMRRQLSERRLAALYRDPLSLIQSIYTNVSAIR